MEEKLENVSGCFFLNTV